VLGWRILKHGEYKIDLPILSEEEEALILKLEERFKDETRQQTVKTREESEELIKHILLSYAEENRIYLDNDQISYLSKVGALHIYGFGFLEPLLLDNNIEEISVIGINKPVYVYIREKGWRSVNAEFTDEHAIADTVNKMAQQIGRRITLQNPRIDAMLPDGSRLHASLPPISNGEISIRKFRERPFSPGELVENKTISKEAMAFLSLVMQGDNSVVIAGNTASGKTTMLNALFSFVPGNERIIIVEETPEINIPHKHQLRLVANKDMGISLKDLVYDTLRMRPDRMIVGEVRNKDETHALFDVLLAGQARGAYATFHAQSAQEAFQRFKNFGVEENDLRSIDYIVIQKRMLIYDPKKRCCSETRRVVEIACQDGILYVADGKHATLSRKKLDSNLLQLAEKLGMSKKELLQEMRERERVIAAKRDFITSFKDIQHKLFGVSYAPH
jgi:Flp pilus assembly CpaF family ATPase